MKNIIKLKIFKFLTLLTNSDFPRRIKHEMRLSLIVDVGEVDIGAITPLCHWEYN